MFVSNINHVDKECILNCFKIKALNYPFWIATLWRLQTSKANVESDLTGFGNLSGLVVDVESD